MLPGKFPKEESYLPFLTTSKPKRISARDQKASTIDHLEHGTPNGCTLRETCDKINFSSREREEDSPNNPEMPPYGKRENLASSTKSYNGCILRPDNIDRIVISCPYGGPCLCLLSY